MSETVTPQQNPKNEPVSEADDKNAMKCDSNVKDVCSADEKLEEVTSSSPEIDVEECGDILPFQTLAVELEEGFEESPSSSADQLMSNQPGESTDALESPEDTVLSGNGFVPQHFGNEGLSESPAVSNGDTEQDSMILTGSTSLTPALEDDAAVDFDTSMYLQQQMEEGNQKNAKAYLEDFLLSSGPSSAVAHDSDSTSNDEKGLPLHRFPKIVKQMEKADYSILQVLYRLLYLRNAWDTEKILAQRILEFSGFNCDLNSEDFYTREVMLRTVPCDVLLSIGKVLALENISNSTDFEKVKVQLVSKIMNFLYRPKRRPRKSRSGPSRQSSQNRARGGKTNSMARGTTQGPSSNKIVQPNSSDTAGASDISQPTSLSEKSKMPVSYPEKILQLERSIKQIIQDRKIVQPKVDLELLDLNTIKKLTSKKPEKVDNKNTEEEKTIKKTICDKEAEDTLSENSKDDTPKNETANKTVAKSETVQKKLKDFQHVISSIEGTPEELLSEVYYLLYLKKPAENEMKNSILEFSGFPFKEDSDQFKTTVHHLNSMNESTVKDIARALYLDPKVDKEGTITSILEFLKEPDEKYLRPTVAPGMLSDFDVDIEGMSDLDSDDSITCEVVPKHVECIDLISSGDESDSDKKLDPNIKIKKEPEDKPAVQAPQIPQVPPTPQAPPSPQAPITEPINKPKRRLRDFETITKIVNTHPTEYLVDIYNLLYMIPYEPATLRRDILDFSGFEFEKGTPDYIKRKQFLDRMLYNSVRRIYNTLIHNTREVKVFSKPTMIGEIFQFLFKLPDTDTSVRLPPPKLGGMTTLNLDQLDTTKQSVDMNVGNRGLSLPSQTGKLSDLKRVFQRVACFPCEYLVDVHKLLFMTDCDIKDIRANIFGFKGFSFGPDSPEFNQRKLYLEYLTFHSLRKISSVLTTKTVDLRNSTKHELASHLTEVLKEYTNTSLEEEIPQPPSYASETASICNPVSADSAVEQIVVTPIIPSFHGNSCPSPEPPTAVTTGPGTYSVADDRMTVSSSTPALNSQFSSSSFLKQNKFFKSKERNSESRVVITSVTTSGFDSSGENSSGAETNPKPYQSNIKIVPKSVTTLSEPVVTSMECQPPAGMEHHPPNAAYGFRPEFLLQQVTSPFPPHLIPPGMPFIQTYPQPIHIQNPYVLPTPGLQHMVNTDEDPHMNLHINANKEDSEHGHASKRAKMISESPEGSVEAVRIVDSHSLADKKDDPAASFHLKIRDAMTKESEDEEDCDKPLSMLVGHPNDKVLKQQICEIVENTDLQEITINGVIQKIFDMYPKFNLNYRKEFIKSTLRSLLYRLGEHDMTSKSASCGAKVSDSPDCSVSTTDPRDSPEPNRSSSLNKHKRKAPMSPSFQEEQSS